MTTHNFFNPDRNDPDWQFSPEEYYERDFKFLGASKIELNKNQEDAIILRQTPTERGLYAKKLHIEVEVGALLNVVVLNDSHNSTEQVIFYDIHLHDGATLNLGIFAKNGKFNKHIIGVMQDSESTFNSYGIASNDVQGCTEIVTKVVHAGFQSASNQTILGISGEGSQTVYQGMIVGEPNAIGCEIGIENVNLITGIGGRCFSKPETYVDTEFASTGFVSETVTLGPEHLFYLQSRGLSEKDSKELITSGFKNQVLSFIPNETIQEEITALFSN